MSQILIIAPSFVAGVVCACVMNEWIFRKQIAQRDQLVQEGRALTKDIDQQISYNQNLVQQMKSLQNEIAGQILMNHHTNHDHWVN